MNAVTPDRPATGPAITTSNTRPVPGMPVRYRTFSNAAGNIFPDLGNASLVISTEERRHDTQIIAAIAHTLEWNRLTPGNAIHIESSDGNVSLTGQACTHHDREEAAMLANRIPGVKKVDNRIEVLSDEALSGQIKSVIAEVLSRRTKRMCAGLDITMKNGVVTLSGTVRSLAEKRLVLDVLNWVHQVQGIEDRLEVEPDSSALRSAM